MYCSRAPIEGQHPDFANYDRKTSVRHGKWLLDFRAVLAVMPNRLCKPFCGFATCVLAYEA